MKNKPKDIISVFVSERKIKKKKKEKWVRELNFYLGDLNGVDFK